MSVCVWFGLGCTVPAGAELERPDDPLPPLPATADEAENDTLARAYTGARTRGALSPAQCLEFSSAFETLDRSGSSRLASFNQGVVLQECGDDEGAKDVFEALLHRDSARWEARNNLGVIAWTRGEVDIARRHFDVAVSKAPYEVVLRTNLAATQRALFVRSGESKWFDEAEAHLQAALAVDAASRTAYEGLVGLYYERARAGDNSYALLANLVSTQGKRVLSERGETSVRLTNLDGLLAMHRDRPNEARAFFQAAAKLDPDAPEPRANAAFLALRQRDVASAKADLLGSERSMAKDKGPRSGALVDEVTLALGVAHTRSGAFPQGETHYVAVAHDPRSAYNLGILYQERIAPADEGNGRDANIQAKAHFKRFIDEAADRRDLADARTEAARRIDNIDDYVVAIDDGDRIAKEVAAMEAAYREEQEARRVELLELERRAREAADADEAGAEGR